MLKHQYNLDYMKSKIEKINAKRINFFIITLFLVRSCFTILPNGVMG